MKVLIDTNVMIDVLQNRQPWVLDGTSIFRAVAVQQITGCITAKQIADIHFFSRKLFSGQDNVDARTRQITGRILSLFTLIDTLASDCRDALGNSNGDYEDAITVGNGASLTFTNCPPIRIYAEHSNGIIGNTGSETLAITDSEELYIYQDGQGWKETKWSGISNFVSVFVENSEVTISYPDFALAMKDVGNCFLSSNMMAKTFYLSEAYAAHFDSDKKTFLFRPYWEDEDWAIHGGLYLVPFVPIDEAHFPDDNFRAYVKEEKDDRPADGRLDQQEAGVYSKSETEESTYYITIDVTDRDISSLKGIEYFPELEILNITRNNITELDVSPFKYLLKLVTTSNPLKSLDVTKSPQLRNLRCDYNQLTRLDLSKSDSLISLNCTIGPEISLGNMQIYAATCTKFRLKRARSR